MRKHQNCPGEPETREQQLKLMFAADGFAVVLLHSNSWLIQFHHGWQSGTNVSQCQWTQATSFLGGGVPRGVALQADSLPTELSGNLKNLIIKISMCVCVQSCCNPMDYSSQGSSVHGILQARILEWVSFSRGSFQPRDQTCVSCVSCIGRWILYQWATWEARKLA